MAITFGKRVAGVASPAAPPRLLLAEPDPDGVTRAIPKAVWDGPWGDLLRRHGFQPDDPKNLTLTPERARALEEAELDRMNALVAKVNAHIPGVTLAPWAIIPWDLWKGPNADFLMKHDFFPSAPWNNMLLAADAKSSTFLGLPQHPRAPMTALDSRDLTRLIDELRVEFWADVKEGLAGLARGNLSFLERHATRSNERFGKLFALTRYISDLVWGNAVCARHDELFGLGLKAVTG